MGPVGSGHPEMLGDVVERDAGASVRELGADDIRLVRTRARRVGGVEDLLIPAAATGCPECGSVYSAESEWSGCEADERESGAIRRP